MEQHIGHRAYYENLRRFVDQSPELQADWVEVTYAQPGSLWERVPLLPQRFKGTLVGREQVRRGLRRHPSDVWLFNTQVPAALAGRMVQERPYLLCTDITPRQYDTMAAAYGHAPDGDGLLSRYKHRANVRLLQGAARLLPWSGWVRDGLVTDYGVDPRRIEVIPPGVDIEKWRPAPENRGRTTPRILFVGGDLARKGGDLLLDAFRGLPPGLAELVLVTRTAVPTEPGVTVYNHLRPNSPELVALYQSCDLFVLPTRAEAFGIAAVEAAATGLPVVATQVGGLPEIVAEGETGFLVAPDDARALRARLNPLLENTPLRLQMGHAARQRVLARFDARRNAARIVEILRETAVACSNGRNKS